MPVLSDVHVDTSLLNDAFDFSRYPIFKTRNAKPSTMPYEPRHRVRGRALFTCYGLGSPPWRAETCWRSRNVSEPQLVSSTNYMRESWFTNVASARTVGDIADLSDDEDICLAIHPSQSTADIDAPGADSWCDVDDDFQKTSCSTPEDSCDAFGNAQPSDHRGGEDSFYSTDSADQDAHPLLLSMPVIPQIKLERKATLRKPDSEHPPDAAQNQSFLSPRVRDFRTPASKSSRRYGRILARTSPQAMVSDVPTAKSEGHGVLALQAVRRFGTTSWSDLAKDDATELAYMRSASEPMLNSLYTSHDEKEPLLKKETDESLSTVDEVDSSFGSYSENLDLGIDKSFGPKPHPPKHLKRNHQRSFVNGSISFSSLVHAVGCASLDLLRKPRTRAKSTIQLVSRERLPSARDPTSKWAPKDGQVILKVFVPSTDDIWMFRVPQDVDLAGFTSRVATKLGFAVSFSGSLWDEPKYHFTTDEQFRSWVRGRIRCGRNLPIVGHVLAPLPLVRLSVDADGCEVWCYA